MYIFSMDKKAVVSRNEFQILGALYTLPEKLILLFFITWIAASLPCWSKNLSDVALQQIRGNWVDVAFSDILSERYDCPVRVSRVVFKNWSEIHFASIRIRSKAGRELIYGSKGSFKLRKMELKKQAVFETEINLKNVFFTKEYYKDQPALKKWGYLMHKPIAIKDIRLNVVQNREFTRLNILDCESDMLHLEGGLVIDKTGKVKDSIKATYNPWALLRSTF